MDLLQRGKPRTMEEIHAAPAKALSPCLLDLNRKNGLLLFLNSTLHSFLRKGEAYAEVRKSPIHGRGIFATAEVEMGRVLTLYPAHAVAIDHYVHTDEKFADFFSKDIHTYGVALSEDVAILGHPEEVSNPYLLGHMANDGVGNSFSLPLSEIEANPRILLDIAQKYTAEQDVKCNCSLMKCPDFPVLWVVAKRDIKKDEEPLVAYGLEYWFDVSYGIGSSGEKMAELREQALAERRSWMKELCAKRRSPT